jgi:rare lipoprotein A
MSLINKEFSSRKQVLSFSFAISFLVSIVFWFCHVPTWSQYYETGMASYYARKFNGRVTANGERYDPGKMTAAHPTLPFGTFVRVTNLANAKKVTVRVNDRGPFIKGRVIDLSRAAAEKIDMLEAGVVKVKIEEVPREIKHDKPEKPRVATVPATKKPEKTFPTHSPGYFMVSSSKSEPAGYGIQTGYFTDMGNLLSFADKLQEHVSMPIYIYHYTRGKENRYKVIAGEFKNRDSASQMEKKLKKYYPDCFVVKF